MPPNVELHDNVNHPQHYGGEIECIEYLTSVLRGLSGVEAFCIGNAIKYIHRFPYKRKLEDLRKAKWYLDFIIRRCEEAITETDK